MFNLKCIYFIVISLLILISVEAWDSDQLEVFDLVEEINQNFYSVLNVSQDAELKDIKKAFRSLSLILHPDKNDAADAEIHFRELVAVYDVLKDSNKRAYYDDVLRNGLPNWRSAVYYYRHVRKLGLMETLITLFIIITIGQYLVAWGAYVEKKYTAEQIYEAKVKKATRKRGTANQVAEFQDILFVPKPSFLNTLPVQIPKGLWFLVKNLVPAIVFVFYWIKQKFEKPQLENNESDNWEQIKSITPPVRKRKKASFIPKERSNDELPPPIIHVTSNQQNTNSHVPISGGLWTDDDLSELILLVKKYPGGTTDRWEKIAETMHRTVAEVTYMANKMKENNYRLSGQDEETPEVEVPKKQKTKGGKLNDPNVKTNANWTQTQQKALEVALAKHPKGPADRWERIAKCVPDKTKEECILRYKYLVEIVKKQKEKPNENGTIDE